MTWRSPRAAWAAAAGGVVAFWALAAAVLPDGLPPGVILLGVVLGGLTSLTAAGLVLIYRSSRIINFAQAEIGALGATVGLVLVLGWHVSYWLAVPAGVAVAIAAGALIDAVVVRRLFDAPRLILTVATVGILQVLGAGEIWIPPLFSHLATVSRFRTPFAFNFRVRPIEFDGDYLVAIIVIPLVLVGLGLFLWRSDTGIAIRASADSGERALLLGIPVRRLSRIVWMVASGLSAIAALLTAPILGPQLGAIGGPVALLAPLAAAVVGRMESIPRTVMAAIGIGVFEQAVFWNYPRSSTVDVALVVVILGALLLQRRQFRRVDDAGLGGYVAVQEVRPIPDTLKGLSVVRWARRGAIVGLAAAAIGLPFVLRQPRVILINDIALTSIVAVSLVVLTGWAGQISLGQFAFVGIGAGVTASLLVHHHSDLFVALLGAAAVGAVAALLIGLPALRIPGFMLAAATLAFAVPVSTFLLNRSYFPILTPQRFNRPVLFDRFSLETPRTLYYLSVAALTLAVAVAHNFRKSRAGRVVVAVRDNERGAAGYGISPVRAKLTAFSLSGALAGLAGGLFVVADRRVGFLGFDPIRSLVVFTAVVVGGLGSLSGAILGAAYVGWAESFLHGGARYLATGAGLLALVLVVPGGLGGVVYSIRDALLRALARSQGLAAPGLILDQHQPGDVDGLPPPAADSGAAGAPSTDAVTEPKRALLTCDAVDAGYGQMQVLFGVNATVAPGQVLALLGTNGAGKSTLLRVVAGLLTPTNGRVVFDGQDITDLGPIDRVKAGIATVPGGRGVFPSLTVAENLRMAGWLFRHDPAGLAEREQEALQMFPALRARHSTRASLLSGGEQQMLTLAQAFYLRPRLLLIDELSLGLAPVVVSRLLEVVRRLNTDGATVVIVEQSVNVAAQIASEAVFLEKGEVRFTGATEGLLDRPDLLRAVFLGDGTRRRSRRVSASPSRRAAAVPDEPGDGRVSRRAAVVRDAPGDGSTPRTRLELIDVTRNFGGVQAVGGVDLVVPDGHTLGIIGANGAGKTTLFDLCSGYLSVDRGRVLLDGVDITHLTAAQRAELGLGRTFQDARLFPSMTVSETIATALERHVEVRDPLLCAFRTASVVDSERAVAVRVDELLSRMRLEQFRNTFVSELSTGTRRIVELACAMAHEPSVLLLDEPSSGIAQRETEALGEILGQLRDDTGATLVIIEHDIPLVSAVADQLVCLHLGQVIATGESRDVLRDPAVIASYLGTDRASIERSAVRPGRRTRSRPGVTLPVAD